MTHHHISRLQIVVILFAIHSFVGQVRAQRVVGSGAISGYVYCADTNLPARFAAVRVQSITSLGSEFVVSPEGVQTAASSMTDLNGNVYIDDLKPGRYVILVTLPGYVTPLSRFAWHDLVVDSLSPLDRVKERLESSLPQATVDENQVSLITVRLERGAEIRGTISFDDGSPAIGIRINISRKTADGNDWQEMADGSGDALNAIQSDDRGQFRIPALPAGKYLLSVRIPPEGQSVRGILGGQMTWPQKGSFPGHLEIYFGNTIRRNRSTVVELAPNETRLGADLQIPLSQFRVLAGRVASEYDGHPLGDASLLLRFADDRSPVVRAHVGEDGSFRIPFVLDGEYLLSVSAAPDGRTTPPHIYKDVEVPITVEGDVSGISISLPDTRNSLP